jgi:hypothetical protein
MTKSVISHNADTSFRRRIDVQHIDALPDHYGVTFSTTLEGTRNPDEAQVTARFILTHEGLTALRDACDAELRARANAPR